ncbi:MAG: hypothetical protein ACXVIG_02775 [Halobacteriota archaeon]
MIGYTGNLAHGVCAMDIAKIREHYYDYVLNTKVQLKLTDRTIITGNVINWHADGTLLLQNVFVYPDEFSKHAEPAQANGRSYMLLDGDRIIYMVFVPNETDESEELLTDVVNVENTCETEAT